MTVVNIKQKETCFSCDCPVFDQLFSMWLNRRLGKPLSQFSYVASFFCFSSTVGFELILISPVGIL